MSRLDDPRRIALHLDHQFGFLVHVPCLACLSYSFNWDNQQIFQHITAKLVVGEIGHPIHEMTEQSGESSHPLIGFSSIGTIRNVILMISIQILRAIKHVLLSLDDVLTAMLTYKPVAMRQLTLCESMKTPTDSSDEEDCKHTTINKKHDNSLQSKTVPTATSNKIDISQIPVQIQSTTCFQTARKRPLRRNRRRVLIWDLDETLVLFASLYSGQFARIHGKDVATSILLGEQMMTYLVAVLERHFFFSELHDADIDHISCLSTRVDTNSFVATENTLDLRTIEKGSSLFERIIATRYATMQHIFERKTRTDFMDDPASPWYAARKALIESIDGFSAGWIQEARAILELTQQSRANSRNTRRRSESLSVSQVEEHDEEEGEDEVIEDINIMVTNTQLAPALCKCLIYNLHPFFSIDRIYSSSKVRKQHCFETIMAKYTSHENDERIEFVAIGDGPEEEHVSRTLGITFHKIETLSDLKQLRYELHLDARTNTSIEQAS